MSVAGTTGISTTKSTSLKPRAATADFSTEWLRPGMAAIDVHGEIDASNAPDLAEFALRSAGECHCIVMNLGGVKFFGTEGFSALHAVNVQCAAAAIRWALVPSPAVSRLLRICDPAGALPAAATVDAAAAIVQGEPRRMLQLVDGATA